MIIIEKENTTITFMSRKETGVLDPMERIFVDKIKLNGWNEEDAKSIRVLMSSHNMKIEEAEAQHKENLEWVN